ncbi:MAG: Tex family protein [Bacilli bacterium]
MKSQEQLFALVAKEVTVPSSRVATVVRLSEEGNTVPFIARYRKEMTGAMDEVQIRQVLDRYAYAVQLETRKEECIRTVEEKGKLTEELKNAFLNATKLQEVEDLYRPFKEKRRTRATVAKERGLEPLADGLLNGTIAADDRKAVLAFVSEESGVPTIEDALAGAADIAAELIADDAKVRKVLREWMVQTGVLETVAREGHTDEKETYRMYYAYEEPVKTLAHHRVLAVNRAEKQEVVRVYIRVSETDGTARITRTFRTKARGAWYDAVVTDSFKRLLFPSLEREIRRDLTEEADKRAIHIFGENVRNLLLQPPLKGKVVLGIDPAYRTGCKLAAVDATGKLLETGVIYPHTGGQKAEQAGPTLVSYIKKHAVEVMAIGNGTASRETEQFVSETIRKHGLNVPYIIVNEAGASVYSASDNARAEFPDLQVEERSAVSIARRVQDPLSELVKIDPKSVGVGQYQHDVAQKQLNESLTFVVERAVNNVGVNANTASVELLQYVSGLSKTVAQNIVAKRNEVGTFRNRNELKKIPRLGAKTYQQAIGFLRILDGTSILDRTSIHPEQYSIVSDILKVLGLNEAAIGTPELEAEIHAKGIGLIATQLEQPEVVISDIVRDLVKPGRDPRDELPQPLLRQDVLSLEDLCEGMELQGTVRNVVDFGVFVDIGVKQDGLAHRSKLQRGFVKHPLDVVSVGDIVTVWVESVESKQKRIALTMIAPKEKKS